MNISVCASVIKMYHILVLFFGKVIEIKQRKVVKSLIISFWNMGHPHRVLVWCFMAPRCVCLEVLGVEELTACASGDWIHLSMWGVYSATWITFPVVRSDLFLHFVLGHTVLLLALCSGFSSGVLTEPYTNARDTIRLYHVLGKCYTWHYLSGLRNNFYKLQASLFPCKISI